MNETNKFKTAATSGDMKSSALMRALRRQTRRGLPLVRNLNSGTQTQRLKDAILAILLASAFAYYIDFKISKPGEVKAILPPTIEELPEKLPAGVDNIQVEFVDPPSFIRFAIDGPREVVDRLRDRTPFYELSLSPEEISAGLSAGGMIEHLADITNVVGLSDRVHQRRDESFPQPATIAIRIQTFCVMSISDIRIEGQFLHKSGLEVGAPQFPPSSVRVKILDLPQVPAHQQAILYLKADSVGELTLESELSLPLTSFASRVQIGGQSYRAEVLDPMAVVALKISQARTPIDVKVQFDPNFPEGVSAPDVPQFLEMQFLVPGAREQELRQTLVSAATDGRPFIMRATILWPMTALTEDGPRSLTKDPDPGSILDLEVILVEPPPPDYEIEWMGFKRVNQLSLQVEK